MIIFRLEKTDMRLEDLEEIGKHMKSVKVWENITEMYAVDERYRDILRAYEMAGIISIVSE